MKTFGEVTLHFRLNVISFFLGGGGGVVNNIYIPSLDCMKIFGE